MRSSVPFDPGRPGQFLPNAHTTCRTESDECIGRDDALPGKLSASCRSGRWIVWNLQGDPDRGNNSLHEAYNECRSDDFLFQICHGDDLLRFVT